MNILLYSALAETDESTLAGEVSEILETAGDRAGSFLTHIPEYSTRLILAGLIILIGWLVIRLGRRVIAKVIKVRTTNTSQVNTVKTLMTSIFNYLMYFIIATSILSVFGINVSSLLTVAGIGGVALGFGAQTLVQDVISGLFIWGEGSIAVGDIVEINSLQGVVESVAIRATVIRNYNGNLYTIPNGEIRTITNMSRDYKRAIVDVRCPYEENQDRMVAILNEEMEKAGHEIEGVTSTPEVMSILSFETDCVVARIAVQCPVGEHWRIEREIRTRVKNRFDQEGIVMPHYVKPVVS